MKHAVIVAHPNPKSLSLQIAETYAQSAETLRQTAVIRDLYRMGFDPCLKAQEAPGATGWAMGEDVRRERELLADADVFAFVYPLWFNAPPAMLKGYVDRVFGMGFGFEPAALGANAPLLEGRRLISFTTSGAPESWVKETGAVDALIRTFDQHVAAVCGLSFAGHVNFAGVAPGITRDAVDDILARTREAVRRAFDPAANQVA